MKRKILIITTKNCFGCSIAINNTQTVIAKSSKEIALEIKDFTELPKRLIHKYRAYDYPTTVFLEDDNVTFTMNGEYYNKIGQINEKKNPDNND